MSFFMLIKKKYFLYITSNTNDTVLYVGVTNDLSRRIMEHKTKRYDGFTARYNVNKLIYYEVFNYIDLAIKREKTLKGWTRDKKVQLINSKNIEWKELYLDGMISTIWQHHHTTKSLLLKFTNFLRLAAARRAADFTSTPPCHPERSEGSQTIQQDH
jgi:putative endonuclease